MKKMMSGMSWMSLQMLYHYVWLLGSSLAIPPQTLLHESWGSVLVVPLLEDVASLVVVLVGLVGLI